VKQREKTDEKQRLHTPYFFTKKAKCCQRVRHQSQRIFSHSVQ